MINLIINNQKVSVPEYSTILEATSKLGIKIPTLCHYNGFKPNTSCMICVVHDLKKDWLIPSCSMPVEEGMEIETDNEKIREARKDTLDLLLSEHVGDCQAPCQRACPAGMNIPLMIRQIKEKKFEEALITVKKDIALPAVLGRICPAPCENGCNRKYYDNAVSICHLKRFVADVDLSVNSSFKPELKLKSGKKVAIIGTGPTGLSAAYYLAQLGHDCVIYDKNEKPGGLLRYGVPEEKLPSSILDVEIEQIGKLGITFNPNQTLSIDFSIQELKNDFDSVILALGKTEPKLFLNSGIELGPRGIVINRKTYETKVSGVFTGGNTIAEGKMAIRSAAHGKFIATSVDQYVSGKTVTGPHQRFNSILGKLQNDETAEFIKESKEHSRIKFSKGFDIGYLEEEAIKETERCFHCDCRKLESCKLRQYSELYDGNQKRFNYGERKKVQKIVQHEIIIFEPGKCIKCNLCIEITRRAKEIFGFTFINRGFDVQITIPFNESLEKGLEKVAEECVVACPTAALALKKSEES